MNAPKQERPMAYSAFADSCPLQNDKSELNHVYWSTMQESPL